MRVELFVNITEEERARLRSYYWLREAEKLSTDDGEPQLSQYFDILPDYLTERIVHTVVEHVGTSN